MHLEQYSGVAGARSRDDLLQEVSRLTWRLGFEKFTAMVVLDHVDGSASDFLWIDNTPEGYADLADNKELQRCDPVMKHCKRATVPIIWDRETYTAAGRGDKWEMQAPFGYRTGVALALHLPQGKHFFIGVDRDQALPKNQAEVGQIVAELQLFAAYAQDAALRVLVPKVLQRDVPRLSPRELESLRWTMEGKTAWELGHILGISEQTAARHVNNATQKLGCVNKLQAVVKALRLRLIH